MQKKISPPYIIELSRKLRKEMTPAEKILWSKLRKKQLNGFSFRRQHSIGRYIADFYCHDLRLIVELDGDIHYETKEYDTDRDEFLKASGYTDLRFQNDEILNSLDNVLDRIKKCIISLP